MCVRCNKFDGYHLKKFEVGNLFTPKKFNRCKSLSKKFDIYSKIVDRDVGDFVRHHDIVVLSHPFSGQFVLIRYDIIVLRRNLRVVYVKNLSRNG
jgi:hypothetical protein